MSVLVKIDEMVKEWENSEIVDYYYDGLYGFVKITGNKIYHKIEELLEIQGIYRITIELEKDKETMEIEYYERGKR